MENDSVNDAGGSLHIELDTRTYSNMCKRLAAHVKQQHGVHLTHTQARTAAALALGFDSPNALDSLLRAQPRASSGPTQAPAGIAHQWRQLYQRVDPFDEEGRLARISLLRQALSELLAEDLEEVEFSLMNLLLDLLAKRHPATLSVQDKRRIKENYPSTNADLIASRAMSMEGVFMAVAISNKVTQVVIDYLPQSNIHAAKTQDQARGLPTQNMHDQVDATYQDLTERGLSPFGAAATMAYDACQGAIESGVHWSAVTRLLMELIARTIGDKPPSKKEMEANVVARVAKRMRVSEATARKYVRDIGSRSLRTGGGR